MTTSGNDERKAFEGWRKTVKWKKTKGKHGLSELVTIFQLFLSLAVPDHSLKLNHFL